MDYPVGPRYCQTTVVPSVAMADPAIERDLHRWLTSRGRSFERLELLPGDVSPRRYARLHGAAGEPAILAYYPPGMRATLGRYRTTTELLEAAGLRVPRIFDHDEVAGCALVEDLGTKTLFEAIHVWEELLPWYRDTLGQLRLLRKVPRDQVATLNPPLDEALLRRELEATWHSFLEPRGLVATSEAQTAVRVALDTLCAKLADDSPIVCHRDLMARNLVPLYAEDRVGVLDHQDLRLGPPAYDIASLLNDSLYPPPEVEEALLSEAGIESSAARARYHRAAAQRTLKAVGTFARCAAAGSARHGALIAPTFVRALDHLEQVAETADLGATWRAAGASGGLLLH